MGGLTQPSINASTFVFMKSLGKNISQDTIVELYDAAADDDARWLVYETWAGASDANIKDIGKIIDNFPAIIGPPERISYVTYSNPRGTRKQISGARSVNDVDLNLISDPSVAGYSDMIGLKSGDRIDVAKLVVEDWLTSTIKTINGRKAATQNTSYNGRIMAYSLRVSHRGDVDGAAEEMRRDLIPVDLIDSTEWLDVPDGV